MKIAERILGLSPALTVPENPQYESFRGNVRKFEASVALIASGVAAKMLGVDVGEIAGIDVAGVVSTTSMIGGTASAYVTGFMAANDAFELTGRVR